MPSSPAVLDLDALLAPIPGDAPTGADLRADESTSSLYYNLRTLRQECRDAERANEYPDPNNPSPPRPAWDELLSGCEAALREKSKDLEIACWLIEAQARVRRDLPNTEFAGLRDGFKLVNGLCTQYWDALYSIQDESDPAAKGDPIAGLNGKGGRDGTLVAAIRKIPLTLREEPGPFSFWQIKAQQQSAQMGEVEALVRKGARAFYEPLLTDIADARAAFAELEATIRARMEDNAPPTALIRETFDEVNRLVQHVSGIKLDDTAAPGAAAADGGSQAPGAVHAGGVRLEGGFRSRDEALEALLTIARYFREREPQAPISYTIEDAVRRARMPLSELLGELLDDESRRRMLLAAGIMPPKSE